MSDLQRMKMQYLHVTRMRIDLKVRKKNRIFSLLFVLLIMSRPRVVFCAVSLDFMIVF